MNFECERNHLYPRRQAEGVADAATALRRQEVRSDVTPEQRAAFIEEEHALGAELREAYKVPVVTVNFYAPYFMTDNGRAQLHDVTDVALPAGVDADTVMQQLGAARDAIAQADMARVRALAGASLRYFQDSAYKQFTAQFEGGQDFMLADAEGARVGVVLNPPGGCAQEDRSAYYEGETESAVAYRHRQRTRG